MPLAAIVTDIDTVDEGLRGLYVESDGVFKLDISSDEAEKLADVSGLKKTIDALRKQTNTAEKIVKAWEATGKTPDEVLALLQKAADEEQERLDVEGDYNKLKDKFEAEKRSWTEQLAEFKAAQETALAEKDERLRQFRLENDVQTVALANGVRGDRIKAVMALVGNRFKLDEKGEINHVGDDGLPNGESIKDFFDSYKKEMPEFYVGTQNSGGGTPPNGTGNGGAGAFTLTRAEGRDPARYAAARDAAAKAGTHVTFSD